ncbi:MAG: DUF1800 domain-containing protein [Chloroflexi bacterium]|nr:DUF1800 domain-containing protein [Chloroflexota bacterium]
MTHISRRDFLKLSTLAAATAASGVGKSIQWIGVRPVYAAELSPELHLLNRTTWAIRPEDIARIQAMGLEGYLDWQLNPEAIDDPAIDEFLTQFPVLTYTRQQLSDAASMDYSNVHDPALWGRLYRAAYSERQLFELMVEFWTDHFNIPIADLLTEKVMDDREVIRRHALGKFRDMLLASAQSPAMLSYLNNASSDQEHPNENYAREVMELHTLGVDGGYTEADVKALARILTGWTVGSDGEFTFNYDMHDNGEKTFLGGTFPAGRGIEDGLQALDMLATHPSTARFVSYKLCRRFVSDTPPDSLIESTTQVFVISEGDLRQVMRHILTSAEFNAAPNQKFRRPLDVMVAILRVLRDGLDIQDYSIPVWWFLEPMGQVPFYWHPPNGYPDAVGAWMNTNGLLNRWNAAMLIPLAAEGWYDGMSLDLSVFGPTPATVGELADKAIQLVLAAAIDPADRDQLIYYLSDYGDPNQPVTEGLLEERLTSLLGLLMASPYFQWH